MKKIFMFACAAIAVMNVSAQYNYEGLQSETLEDGFYRVKNVGTGRYAYISDKSSTGINYQATSADMGAVALYTDEAGNRYSDPASVCYVYKESHKHNIVGQNTSLYDIIDHFVQIQDALDGKYWITPLWRVNNKETNIYLYDAVTSHRYGESYLNGHMNTTEAEKAKDNYQWQVEKVDFTNEYLGIKPAECMKIADKYYKPYIVGFDMKLSEGMKALYVSEIKDDAIIIAELDGNIVPANTPVILECSGATAAENKVTLLNGEGSQLQSAQPADNKLVGNYFCYGEHGSTGYTKYKNGTMRVLAVVDGKLQYITEPAGSTEHTSIIELHDGEDVEYVQCINGNESFLRLPQGTPSLPAMTAEEYKAWKNNDKETTFPDINVDNKLDADDVYYVPTAEGDVYGGIVAMILEQIPEKYHADVNKNGVVSIADVCKLIGKLLKGETTLENQE